MNANITPIDETTFFFRRTPSGAQIWFEKREGGSSLGHFLLDPKESLALFNHSPTGFEWGYGGSGPAQAALAVLLKAGVPPAAAVYWHQTFKWDFVSRLDREGGSITSTEIGRKISVYEQHERNAKQANH